MYRIKNMGRVLSLLDFEEVIRTRVMLIIRDTGFCKIFPLCSELCSGVLYSWEDSVCSMTGTPSCVCN